jgi:beta-lactamase class A
MNSRRTTLKFLAGSALLAQGCARNAPTAQQNGNMDATFSARLASIESAAGGKLGAFVWDAQTQRAFGHRMDTRFGMCSTFKLPLAALILRESDAGRLSLDTVVPITKADVVPHAPVAGKFIDQGGLTIRTLAEAAQITSDNIASNLLLKLLGGPAGFTRALRSLGDETTRLDRIEPHMNLVPPGEERDTTTPRAMAMLTATLLTSDALSPTSRSVLIDWMVATKTGVNRIRAGVPAGWRVGDKTGTAMAPEMPDKINDVAALWPPSRVSAPHAGYAAPIIVAVFYEAPGQFGRIRAEDEAVHARVGALAAEWAAKL